MLDTGSNSYFFIFVLICTGLVLITNILCKFHADIVVVLNSHKMTPKLFICFSAEMN